MTDYRLDGLSARTFEHLVQALGLKAVTNTLTPFGDGPDGGREATFDGPTDYGPIENRWNGYGIIQAKFLQRPRSSNSANGAWLIKEMRKEFRKYNRRGKGVRHLDYYIIATNITLTAVGESGTKDQVQALLAEFAKCNGLVAYDVWDYDKLRILLDSNDGVRRSYAAWITPGDVLMQLSDWLQTDRPDFGRLITNYLQKELLSDQFAKLEQAGHTADEAIPLAHVFVDLPVASGPYSDAEGGPRAYQAKELPLFVAFLTAQAADRLVQSDETNDVETGQSRPLPGRFVLIGGPGQGKTTLGQFVCQVFRASLLEGIPRSQAGPDIRKIVDEFSASFDEKRLSRPVARRLPFRVVLSDFAAAMAEGIADSLLGYLAGNFGRRTNSSLTAHQFQTMIASYPSILVLDGLDEVPASSNRSQVLAAIQDFSVDVATGGMDMLILATSRPQGYDEDFSPQIYDHRWLVPLPKDKAIEYGTKLANVRFFGDADRISKIVGRLELASQTIATARIMRSPLQVTILTLLVDRRGQLPQERWALFDEYYTLIYQRETERDIPAAVVLREHKDDIDAVHRLVGLLLQVESEKSGKTDARLTTAQFSDIVGCYLRSEGNQGEALRRLRDAIIEGAANRLVFLVGLESGEVGFEIRSLQEFMAAEGLLDAEDGLVQSRLRAVAPNSNWRNVVLFAAGKIFSERRYLRDTVESICVELNEGVDDIACRLTFAGSELALDLLEDGPVARQPAKNRSLTRLAIRLLEMDNQSWPKRLAALFQDSVSDIFIEELSLALESRNSHVRQNAWICLGLIIQGIGHDDMCIELIEVADGALSAGSRPGADAIVELIPGDLNHPSEWLRGKLLEIGSTIDPRMLQHAAIRRRMLSYGARRDRLRPAEGTWLEEVIDGLVGADVESRYNRLRVVDRGGRRRIGEATLVTIRDGAARKISWRRFPAEHHIGWDFLRVAEDFARSPTKHNLAIALRAAEAFDSPELLPLRVGVPWVLEECLLAGVQDGNLSALADAAESGLLSDQEEWEKWEESWRTDGIDLGETLADIQDVILKGAPATWFPMRTAEPHFGLGRQEDLELVWRYASSRSGRLRESLLFWIASIFRSRVLRVRLGESEPPPPIPDVLTAIAASDSWMFALDSIEEYEWTPPVTQYWVKAFASGGRKSDSLILNVYRTRFHVWLISAMREYPSEIPGLLVCFASIGGRLNDRREIYSMLERPMQGEPPTVRLSRLLTVLRSGIPLADIEDEVMVVLGAGRYAGLLASAIADSSRSGPEQLEDLLRLYVLSCGRNGEEEVIRSEIRWSLRRRQSELVDERRWRDLGFMEAVLTVVRNQS